jgi:hypothetical protein
LALLIVDRTTIVVAIWNTIAVKIRLGKATAANASICCLQRILRTQILAILDTIPVGVLIRLTAATHAYENLVNVPRALIYAVCRAVTIGVDVAHAATASRAESRSDALRARVIVAQQVRSVDDGGLGEHLHFAKGQLRGLALQRQPYQLALANT